MLVAYLEPMFDEQGINKLAQITNLTSIALETVPRITRA